MRVKVKTLKHEEFIVEVDENGTVGDLKKAVAEARNEDVTKTKLVFAGKPLADDNKTIEAVGLPDATKEPTKFCVVLFNKSAPAPKPAPTSVPATQPAPAPTPVATQPAPAPTPVASQPVAPATGAFNMFGGTGQTTSGTTVQAGNVNDEDDEGADLLGGLPEGMDLNTLMENPQIVETIMQFRLQDPVYTKAYELYPEETQALLSNKAFLFASLNEMGRMLAEQQGLVPRGQSARPASQIQVTEEEKDKLNQLVDMGFPPQEAIQYLRICDGNVDAAASMMMDAFQKEGDEEDD